MRPQVRVLVVQSAATAREGHLVPSIEAEGDLEVVAAVDSAGDVAAVLRRTAPEVVAVDVSDTAGLRVVEQIMGFDPRPVLAVGAADGDASATAVRALVAGAADALPRPEAGDGPGAALLRRRLRALRGVHVVRHQRARLHGNRQRPPGPRAVPIVAVAASTGGPGAVATVLRGLRTVAAAVLVVQHLHPDFVGGFVAWLGQESGLPVEIAGEGSRPRAGGVLVAPGEVHLVLGTDRLVHLDPRPHTLHRPSADVLFASVAAAAGSRAVGVLLTGMGSDGAAGLLQMRQGGAVTIAQDEATSAVFGMPAVAIARGAAEHVLGLGDIAPMVAGAVARRSR